MPCCFWTHWLYTIVWTGNIVLIHSQHNIHTNIIYMCIIAWKSTESLRSLRRTVGVCCSITNMLMWPWGALQSWRAWGTFWARKAIYSWKSRTARLARRTRMAHSTTLSWCTWLTYRMENIRIGKSTDVGDTVVANQPFVEWTQST